MEDHTYADDTPQRRAANIKNDHAYAKNAIPKKKKPLKERESDFFFRNLEGFPEYDHSIVRAKFVQSMALGGACCDVTYEIQNAVIDNMGDYYVDIKLLTQIYKQDFLNQRSHADFFKVNPHIHAFFTNSLYDPEKGIYNPDTKDFTPNDGTKDAVVERNIWLRAFQIDKFTDLDETIATMQDEFCSRVSLTSQGPSGLVWNSFHSTTLAYSLNFFEYGGCDEYDTLPHFVTSRKAITPIVSTKNDCFIQCVKHHFCEILKQPYSQINFQRVHVPTSFHDIVLFEQDNPSLGINVLSFECLNDNLNELSHFEPKYKSKNATTCTHEIVLLFHNQHFHYVHSIEKLLRLPESSGRIRKTFFCFSCLGTFPKKGRLEVWFFWGRGRVVTDPHY